MTVRTSAYRFTVTDSADPQIAALKRLVKIQNVSRKLDELSGGRGSVFQYSGQHYVRRSRVVIKGRLGKNSPHAQLYRRGGAHYRYSAQTIRPEHSARFDVYVHEYSQLVKR